MGPLHSKRAAVIGLGRMGVRYLEVLTSAGATIVAAADMRPETKGKLSQTHPDAHWYATGGDLLANEQLDLVCVATTGPGHAAAVYAAAAAGVPYIFCEKPMATNVGDARRMIKESEYSNVHLGINFGLRVTPLFEAAIDIVRSGAIGEARRMQVTIGGARGLGCVGSHYVDLMRVFLNSEPQGVYGRLEAPQNPNPRGTQFKDPDGWGIYEFTNGSLGILEMSGRYPFPPRVDIIGSTGHISIDLETNSFLVSQMGQPQTRKTYPPIDLLGATRIMLERFMENRPVACGTDGAAALEMVLGIHISDRDGRSCTLPLPSAEYSFDVPIT